MTKMILRGALMGLLAFSAEASTNLLSHSSSTSKTIDLSAYEEALINKKTTILPLAVEIDLLKQLTEFDLGRFLLTHKGLNGYWTSYVIIHGPKKKKLHPLEKWILQDAPTVKATQERFFIFKRVLQTHLKQDIKLASIPCGVMDDLIGLNYEGIKNVTLVGIDLDAESIQWAKNNAKKHHLKYIEFSQRDAWALDEHNEYDIITSNGLNIYEPDDNKVIELYKQFNNALKPGGLLVTSFLTPPPALSSESPWKDVNPDDALKQRAIFSDIIGVTWQAFRTERQTREQLRQAGFEVSEVIYDSQGIFPTVVAKKIG